MLIWKLAFSKISKKNLPKMTPCKTTALRWKSHLHYHLVHILTRNETSIHREHFTCGTFSYQKCCVNEKLVQRGSRLKKSRCPWDGVYLRNSIMFQTGWAELPAAAYAPLGNNHVSRRDYVLRNELIIY